MKSAIISTGYLSLVYYPKIDDNVFQSIRNKYEPYANMIPEHIPLVFPVPETIGKDKLIHHVNRILARWKPFKIRIKGLYKTFDHWLLVVLDEGNDQVIRLHDDLYTNILTHYLRKDLPYIPHVGLGLFSREAYDFSKPSRLLSLDEKKYRSARTEIEMADLNFRRTIDRLTLVRVNANFTVCYTEMEFTITVKNS